MRRGVLALVILVAACGDSTPAPAPAPRAPAAELPAELVFDDAKLDALVFECAKTGHAERLSSLALPLRCDRVRVAVHALHEHLLGLRRPPPDRAQLLAALAALADAKGGATAAALGPLVAAWRTWDEGQLAAETALARRSAAAFDVLGRTKLDAVALAEAMRGSQSPPPKSPGAAQIAFLRAAALVAAAPDPTAVTRDVEDAFTHAESLFDELGWPGGFGSAADALAKRLLAADPNSRLAIHLADRAQAAYARSGDEVRASLVFLTLSQAAEKRGDLTTAEYLADGGRERLIAAHARGREFFDLALRHGAIEQMLGKQQFAARDLDAAWVEARALRLDAAACVDVAEKLATSQFHLGRFQDAHDTALAAAKLHDDAVAAGAAAVEPSRTTLAAVAAEAARQLGRADEAARLYRDAANRRELAAAADPAEWASRDAYALLAAQAQLESGDADGAARAVAAVTSRDGVQAPAHAHAASIYRDAKRFDDAAAELTRAEEGGGAEFKDALTEERARLAAARGDLDGARALFARAIARVKKDADVPVGWEAARVMLDWARMEEGAGRLFEASDLAGRALVELRNSGLEMELDRARELYVTIERRRLWFGEAEKAAAQRIAAGPPGDAARREAALLDLFLVRLELTLAKRRDATKDALAAAETFDAGWRRDLARQVVGAASGAHPWAQHELPPVPADAPARWRLLRDAVAGDGDAAAIAARCGAEEPELRRWAAARLAETPGDPLRAVELRRRADVADLAAAARGLAPDEAVLLVEPMGTGTTVLVVRADGTAGGVGVEGDAGLADLWDAAWVAPSAEHLAAATKRVAESLFPAAVVQRLDGVKRLFVGVSEPLGPLPYDLLPFGDGVLFDRFDVVAVESLTELARARARREPPLVTVLGSPYASLDARHAVVRIGETDAAARTRLFEMLGRSQNSGRDAAAALREAKRALRAEGRPDPNGRPALPPWASFLLRGAP